MLIVHNVMMYVSCDSSAAVNMIYKNMLVNLAVVVVEIDIIMVYNFTHLSACF